MTKKQINNSLSTRMKLYESIPKSSLNPRLPIIIRLDGVSFHTYTKGMNKFNLDIKQAMIETTKKLCEKIPGCVYGYTQSDEISLLLVNYKTLDMSSWHNSEVEKIVSITASIATMTFNKYFSGIAQYSNKEAYFDSRVFNLPKDEVTNYFYWRQQDATRNSIQTLGQLYFTHNELNKKSNNEIQDMLFSQKNINWNELKPYFKRGLCLYKRPTVINSTLTRDKWYIDEDMPILVDEGRLQIENLVYPKEN